MKILITGGSGFIGSRLIDLLLKDVCDHDIVNFDKNISELYSNITVIGDVRNLDALNDACKGVDII